MFYVHGESLTDKAMRVFADDMKAIRNVRGTRSYRAASSRSTRERPWGLLDYFARQNCHIVALAKS